MYREEIKTMLRYRYENIFDYLQNNIKPTEPSPANVDWFLVQILRDISMSRGIADGIIQRHRRNWQQPDSLKENLNDEPSFQECLLFRIVTGELVNIILERMKEYSLTKNKFDLSSIKMTFVKSIIETRIKVEDNKVKIVTFNDELLQRIKNAVKDEYKFESIANLNAMDFY